MSRMTLLRLLKLSLAIIAGIACGSCRQPITLWFNERWATDYVANDCKVKQEIGKPCQFSPDVYISSFEQEAKRVFVTDAACHGLLFRTGVGKTGEWELYVDQEGDAGEGEQNWRLGRLNGDDGLLIDSMDAPERIIRQACSAISDRGGQVGK